MLHAHAVTSLSNSNTYSYDANGNMTYRLVSSQPYTLTYDAENRLTQVSGTATASFGYDGDGKRVVGVENGTTTVYIGNYYEWHGTVTDTIKYYYAGSVRVAMKTGDELPKWLLGDHLGSTSVVANYDGSLDARQGYMAWGEQRFPTGASPLPTTFRYTGQREAAGVGLYFYGARWYDAALGRFVQADTVIPEASQGVQAWDRYAYALNNPVKYIDPSGHEPKDDQSNEGWNFFTWTREERLRKREPLIFRIGEIVFVIMPSESEPYINRPEIFQRLGTTLCLASEVFDVGELIQLPLSGGIGAPDLTALWDVGITQVATWANGQSPVGDKYDSSLPPLFGTNQDVLVQFGDFGIAFTAKAGGYFIGGPAGYVVGVLVDAGTTTVNLVYDHNRNFGSWQSHLMIGTPVCSDCPDLWGLTYIVIWP